MTTRWDEYNDFEDDAPKKAATSGKGPKAKKQKKQKDEEQLDQYKKKNRLDKKNAVRAPWKQDLY